MTIDPKAAELAKALADAVAAQQTEEYQELAKSAERKAAIDEDARQAMGALEVYMRFELGKQDDDFQIPHRAPEPEMEDEFTDPKPNGAME